MAMDPAAELEAGEIARHRIINETIARGDSPVQQFYAGAVVLVTGASGFLGKQLVEKLLRSVHRIINETIARGDSSVQQFYAGAVVLVTGASGFLDKQLVEKLLRSCAVKKIFILLRGNKKYKTSQERMTNLLEDPVYEYLRKVQPDFVDKIVPVSGDVSQSRLGISDNDRRDIIEEVTIIFHGAATIHFMEPLKKATLTNVHGTREMLLLAKHCTKLKSFVHISTAYSHAISERHSREVLEQFYESPISPDTLIDMVENLNERVLDNMTSKLTKGWPNTYAFTKAVAEEAVRTSDLPICIVRPAIVICSYREPLPGWVDRSSVLGPSGFILGSGLGILHVLYADVDSNLDLVPVDLVNNAIILAAQETAKRRDRGDNDVRIYTLTGTRNPLRFGKLIDVIQSKGSTTVASTAAVWYGYAIPTNSKTLFVVLFFFLHYVPAFFVDRVLLMLGKKAMLANVYEKVFKLNSIFGYYMTTTWNFEDSNLRALYYSLSPADRTIFNCNMDTLDWTLYILLWCIGLRKYVIKDGLKDTEKGIRKQKWLKWLNHFTIVTCVYVLYKIVLLLFGGVSYLFSFLLLCFDGLQTKLILPFNV